MKNKTTTTTKGIILAGGSGTRLYPLTKIISKQLLPVYNKPMIYFPLETLINAKIKEILIITTEHDIENFRSLLGNGDEWNVSLSYKIQKYPEGIAQALLIAEKWINKSPVILILGDNLFFGSDFNNLIINSIKTNTGATIFCKKVTDPERFGVVDFDNNNNILSIDEKPLSPKSDFVVTGFYIYDEKVSEYSKSLKKSNRGEYEITDLNKIYLERNELKANFLTEDDKWLDTGTFESLLEASNFVKNIKDYS
tara:strand:+ start:399 stop:1157 length:759 start_codon:yes stop_codon:yes gene_type:complete